MHAIMATQKESYISNWSVGDLQMQIERSIIIFVAMFYIKQRVERRNPSFHPNTEASGDWALISHMGFSIEDNRYSLTDSCLSKCFAQYPSGKLALALYIRFFQAQLAELAGFFTYHFKVLCNGCKRRRLVGVFLAKFDERRQ